MAETMCCNGGNDQELNVDLVAYLAREVQEGVVGHVGVWRE